MFLFASFTCPAWVYFLGTKKKKKESCAIFGKPSCRMLHTTALLSTMSAVTHTQNQGLLQTAQEVNDLKAQ